VSDPGENLQSAVHTGSRGDACSYQCSSSDGDSSDSSTAAADAAAAAAAAVASGSASTAVSQQQRRRLKQGLRAGRRVLRRVTVPGLARLTSSVSSCLHKLRSKTGTRALAEEKSGVMANPTRCARLRREIARHWSTELNMLLGLWSGELLMLLILLLIWWRSPLIMLLDWSSDVYSACTE
jgi:hypothetical protein